ncbi:hypothetical protein Vretimale_2846 [Volvox reticuliferus]|uniref:Uncharacterized protein n=1 Tax=Volvox reticuliferus TaxID=1737510 RepID=A0A8J4BYR6_9CHLO|nr:hypothetical protein Vretifemale_1827 [Volvox reticuliferus]GIL97094.1 hypothetical protein Vretimale_2846 [Volvox reticuliferus]
MYPAQRISTTNEITPASPSSSDGQTPRIQDTTHAAGAAPPATAYPTSGSVQQLPTMTVALPLQRVESDFDDDPFAGYVLPNKWLDESPSPPVEDDDDNEFGGAPPYELGNSSFDDSYELSRVPWLGNGALVAAHTTTVLPPALPADSVTPSTVQLPQVDIDSDPDDDPFAHPRPNYSHGYRVPILQLPLMPFSRSKSPQIPLRPHLSAIAPTAAVPSIAPPPTNGMRLAKASSGRAQAQAFSIEPSADLSAQPGPAGMGPSTGVARKGSSLGSSRRLSSASSDSDPFARYVPEPPPLEGQESVLALLRGAGRELMPPNASMYESEQGFYLAVEYLAVDPASEGGLRDAPGLSQPEDESAGDRLEGAAGIVDDTRADCAGAVLADDAAATAAAAAELEVVVDVMAVGAAAATSAGSTGAVQADTADEISALEANSPATNLSANSGPDSAAGSCGSAGPAAVLDVGLESLPGGADRAQLGNPDLVETVGGGVEDNASPTAASEPKERERDAPEAEILRSGDDNEAQSITNKPMSALDAAAGNGPGTEGAAAADHEGGIFEFVDADGVKCAAETAPAPCTECSSPDEDLAYVHATVLAVIAAVEVLAKDEPQGEEADATEAMRGRPNEEAKVHTSSGGDSVILEQVMVPEQAVPMEQGAPEQQCVEPANDVKVVKPRAPSAQGAPEDQAGRVTAAATAAGEVADAPLAAVEPSEAALEDAEAPITEPAAIEMAKPGNSVASEVRAPNASTAEADLDPESATAASSTGAATDSHSATEPHLKPPLPQLVCTTVCAMKSLGPSIGAAPVAPSGTEAGDTSAADTPPMRLAAPGHTVPVNNDTPGVPAASARMPITESSEAAILAPCDPSSTTGIPATYGRSSVTGRRHSGLGRKAPRQAGPSSQTSQRRDSSTCGSHCGSIGSADAPPQPNPRSGALVGSALTAVKVLRRSAIDLPLDGDMEAEAAGATGSAARRVTGRGWSAETGPGTVPETRACAEAGQARSLGLKAAMAEAGVPTSQVASRGGTVSSQGSGSAETTGVSSVAAGGPRHNRTSSSGRVSTRSSILLSVPMPSDTPATTCSLGNLAGGAPHCPLTSLADCSRQALVATQEPPSSIGSCRLSIASELNAMSADPKAAATVSTTVAVPGSTAAPPMSEPCRRPIKNSRPKTDMAPADAAASSQQASTEMAEGQGLRPMSGRAAVARHLPPMLQLAAPQANFRPLRDSTAAKPLASSTGAPSIQTAQTASAGSLTAAEARQSSGFAGADDGQTAWLACPDGWLHYLSAPPTPPAASGFSDRGANLCAAGGAQITGENSTQCTRPRRGTESSGFGQPQSQSSLANNASSSPRRRIPSGLPLRQATQLLPGMPLLSELISRYPVRQAHASGPEIALVSGRLFVSDRIRKAIEATGKVAGKPSKAMATGSAAARRLSSGPPSPISCAQPKSDWVMPGGPSSAVGACVGCGHITYREKRRAEKAQRAWLAGLYGGPAENGAGAGGGGAEDGNALRVRQGWVWGAAPSVDALGGARTAQAQPVMAVGASPAARRLSATGGIAGGVGSSAGSGDHRRVYGPGRRASVERWLQSACTDAPHDGGRLSQGACAPRSGTARIPGLWSLSGCARPASALQRRNEDYIGTLDLTADAVGQGKLAFRQAPQVLPNGGLRTLLKGTTAVDGAATGSSPKRSAPRRRTSS